MFRLRSSSYQKQGSELPVYKGCIGCRSGACNGSVGLNLELSRTYNGDYYPGSKGTGKTIGSPVMELPTGWLPE
jgi:hypothetical protein